MKSVVAGIGLLAIAMSGSVASSAVYYLEAENYDVAEAVNVYDENSGGLGGDPMSNNYYLSLNNGSGRLLFQIAEGDLPPGTYNIADRGYSSTAERELDLEIASGIAGINDSGFSFVGTTANANNPAPVWPIVWAQMYNAGSGSTLATITMPSSGGITLRYTSQGSAPGSSDVLAFLTAGESLPNNAVPEGGSYTPQIPVPEPAGFAAVVMAGLALLRRTRRID